MFGLGAPEVIIILLVALLVFGPKKLPELGKSLGRGIREFKHGTAGLKDELEASLQDEPKLAPARIVVTPGDHPKDGPNPSA